MANYSKGLKVGDVVRYNEHGIRDYLAKSTFVIAYIADDGQQCPCPGCNSLSNKCVHLAYLNGELVMNEWSEPLRSTPGWLEVDPYMTAVRAQRKQK